MAIQERIMSDTEHADVLRGLLEARAGRHALFLVSGEGRVTPGGFEETSGYVLDWEGRAYFFWAGWNPSRERVELEAWQPTEIAAHWAEDEEYVAARAALGLA